MDTVLHIRTSCAIVYATSQYEAINPKKDVDHREWMHCALLFIMCKGERCLSTKRSTLEKSLMSLANCILCSRWQAGGISVQIVQPWRDGCPEPGLLKQVHACTLCIALHRLFMNVWEANDYFAVSNEKERLKVWISLTLDDSAQCIYMAENW